MGAYLLLKVTHRVRHGAVYTNLEVQVRAEAVAGATGVADDVALRDGLPGRDGEGGLVGVTGGEPATVVDAGVVAVAAAARLGLGEDDGAAGGGTDRVPSGTATALAISPCRGSSRPAAGPGRPPPPSAGWCARCQNAPPASARAGDGPGRGRSRGRPRRGRQGRQSLRSRSRRGGRGPSVRPPPRRSPRPCPRRRGRRGRPPSTPRKAP